MKCYNFFVFENGKDSNPQVKYFYFRPSKSARPTILGASSRCSSARRNNNNSTHLELCVAQWECLRHLARNQTHWTPSHGSPHRRSHFPRWLHHRWSRYHYCVEDYSATRIKIRLDIEHISEEDLEYSKFRLLKF